MALKVEALKVNPLKVKADWAEEDHPGPQGVEPKGAIWPRNLRPLELYWTMSDYKR